MVKITIASNDLLALYRSSETKKYGIHFMRNVIRSKYNYYGNNVDRGFYFISISVKALNELINVLEQHPEVGTSAEFLTGLYYAQKQLNKKVDSEELPF